MTWGQHLHVKSFSHGGWFIHKRLYLRRYSRWSTYGVYHTSPYEVDILAWSFSYGKWLINGRFHLRRYSRWSPYEVYHTHFIKWTPLHWVGMSTPRASSMVDGLSMGGFIFEGIRGGHSVEYTTSRYEVDIFAWSYYIYSKGFSYGGYFIHRRLSN